MRSQNIASQVNVQEKHRLTEVVAGLISMQVNVVSGFYSIPGLRALGLCLPAHSTVKEVK